MSKSFPKVNKDYLTDLIKKMSKENDEKIAKESTGDKVSFNDPEKIDIFNLSPFQKKVFNYTGFSLIGSGAAVLLGGLTMFLIDNIYFYPYLISNPSLDKTQSSAEQYAANKVYQVYDKTLFGTGIALMTLGVLMSAGGIPLVVFANAKLSKKVSFNFLFLPDAYFAVNIKL